MPPVINSQTLGRVEVGDAFNHPTFLPARRKSYFKAGVLIKKELYKPLEEIEKS